MILGIGTDIVSIARIEQGLARFGRRYGERLLHPQEWPAFEQAHAPARLLAKRWAAKEAVVKALGTGFREGVAPRHLCVTHDARGRPGIDYHGPAEMLRQHYGAMQTHLSLSDERDYAIAFVVITA